MALCAPLHINPKPSSGRGEQLATAFYGDSKPDLI